MSDVAAIDSLSLAWKKGEFSFEDTMIKQIKRVCGSSKWGTGLRGK